MRNHRFRQNSQSPLENTACMGRGRDLVQLRVPTRLWHHQVCLFVVGKVLSAVMKTSFHGESGSRLCRVKKIHFFLLSSRCEMVCLCWNVWKMEDKIMFWNIENELYAYVLYIITTLTFVSMLSLWGILNLSICLSTSLHFVSYRMMGIARSKKHGPPRLFAFLSEMNLLQACVITADKVTVFWDEKTLREALLYCGYFYHYIYLSYAEIIPSCSLEHGGYLPVGLT